MNTKEAMHAAEKGVVSKEVVDALYHAAIEVAETQVNLDGENEKLRERLAILDTGIRDTIAWLDKYQFINPAVVMGRLWDILDKETTDE